MHPTAISLGVVTAATACVLTIAMLARPNPAAVRPNQSDVEPVATAALVGNPPVLAERSALYLEDAPGARGVALVHATVAQAEEERARLSVVLSAMGRGVVPVPGLAGVAGSNFKTATEMERLCSAQGVRCAVRAVHTTGSTAWMSGTVRVAERGHLPERRIHDDGTIEWDARHPAWLPLSLRCGFPDVAAGRYEAIVFVEDVPRLSVVFRFDGDSSTVEALTSLGEHLPTLTQDPGTSGTATTQGTATQANVAPGNVTQSNVAKGQAR